MPQDSRPATSSDQTSRGTDSSQETGLRGAPEASSIFGLSRLEGTNAVTEHTALGRLVAAGNEAMATRASSSDQTTSPLELVAKREKFESRAAVSVRDVVQSIGLTMPARSVEAMSYSVFLKNDAEMIVSEAKTALELPMHDLFEAKFPVTYRETTDNWGSGASAVRTVTFTGVPANPGYASFAPAVSQFDSLTINVDTMKVVQSEGVAPIDASMFFATQQNRQRQGADMIYGANAGLPFDAVDKAWGREVARFRAEAANMLLDDGW